MECFYWGTLSQSWWCNSSYHSTCSDGMIASTLVVEMFETVDSGCPGTVELLWQWKSWDSGDDAQTVEVLRQHSTLLLEMLERVVTGGAMQPGHPLGGELPLARYFLQTQTLASWGKICPSRADSCCTYHSCWWILTLQRIFNDAEVSISSQTGLWGATGCAHGTYSTRRLLVVRIYRQKTFSLQVHTHSHTHTHTFVYLCLYFMINAYI